MRRGPGLGEGMTSGPGADGEVVVGAARAQTIDLQEGEIVLLWLRPSLWRLFVPLVIVAVTILLMLAALTLAPHRGPMEWKIGALALLGVAASVWFAVDWWSHAYVLTNRRALSRVGVVWPMIAEAPLSAVWRVALSRSRAERTVEIGTVSCLGSHGAPMVRWAFVAHPIGVQEAVVDAVRRFGRGDVSAESEG